MNMPKAVEALEAALSMRSGDAVKDYLRANCVSNDQRDFMLTLVDLVKWGVDARELQRALEKGSSVSRDNKVLKVLIT